MKKLSILVLLGLAGCGDPQFEKVWSESQGALKSATKVELAWLAVPGPPPPVPGDQTPPKPPDMNYWSWSTKGMASVADAAAAKKIVDVLLDEKSYYRGPPKACLPMPGVKLHFIADKREVTVLICFECRTLFVKGPEGSQSADDFDPGAPALIAALKSAFPKDAGIQSLK